MRSLHKPRYELAPRRGFSLVEMIVTIATIAVLTALLLPAVHSVRAAARLVECRDRVRQLVLATHNFTDSFQHYPNESDGSPFDLLPYLEETALHDAAIDLTLPDPPTGIVGFVCPQDREATLEGAHISYLFNGGTRLDPHAANGIVSKFSTDQVRPRDVTDGLSQTAAISERLFSLSHEQRIRILRQGIDTKDNPRYTHYLPARVASTPSESEFVDACLNHRVGAIGDTLIYGNPFARFQPSYSHLLPPNTVGCFNGSPVEIGIGSRFHGVTATSLHTGGVTVAFCDGHAQFVNDQIDLDVWRALGTRNGHETVGEF